MVWSSPVRSLLAAWFSHIPSLAALVAATSAWRRRTKPESQTSPSAAAPDRKPAGRVIQFRTPVASTAAATIGPCLSCRCDHVHVHLLTNFIRYCECPRCGSAWTEPAKARISDPDLPYYPSEPLKFVRDRN
jgi:hypothetical protein